MIEGKLAARKETLWKLAELFMSARDAHGVHDMMVEITGIETAERFIRERARQPNAKPPGCPHGCSYPAWCRICSPPTPARPAVCSCARWCGKCTNSLKPVLVPDGVTDLRPGAFNKT